MSFSFPNDHSLGNGQPTETERFTVTPDGPDKLKVQQQTWAAGMGWFTQKSMVLGEEQALALLRELEYGLNMAKMLRTAPQHPAQAEAAVEPLVATEPEPLVFPANRRPKARSDSAKALATQPDNVLQFRSRTKRAL